MLGVNRIGFGAMRLPQVGPAFEPGSPPRDRSQAVDVLRKAVDLGVNHIDTAAFYFSALRSANELINSALAPYPDDLVIATKVGPSRDPSGDWRRPPATPGQLRGQVEENLRQLGRDHLDLVYLRAQEPTDLSDRFAALVELQEAGLIRHLGISAVSEERLAEALAIAPVTAVQNAYGLGFRPEQDDLIRLCGEQDVAYVPYFSVATTNRETGGTADPEEVQAIAKAHGATPTQVLLAWTLARGPNVFVIPGTGDPKHLAENMASADLRLTAGEMAGLDALHKRSQRL
ncbi:aldo/keto reductase [Actinophytocola sp.]|uniref:aldo/keto reductase n=1 Tax=Actinophytocola sp. TaxID=1872138 RepID=UPI002D23BD16|nr:aldo/keto reductase [Actinophytocola sp.]HYQ66455.1 aldo/keto reductase [Actinophytocola sp.]